MVDIDAVAVEIAEMILGNPQYKDFIILSAISFFFQDIQGKLKGLRFIETIEVDF